MRLLTFFRNKHQKTKSKRSGLSKQGVGPAEGAELLIEGDDDPGKLARFRVEARLVKQVPIDRTRPLRSWYGGKPQMPDYLVWPTAKGKPMVFVAQIDCSELPSGLWGGVGPQTGSLLVFLAPSYPQNSDLPVRVIHTTDLGAERDAPAIPEVDWLFTSTRQASPSGAALTFPKWPLAVQAKATDAPEPARQFDRSKGAHDGDRPNPSGLPWPGGPAGNPLTPIGLKMLYDSLTTSLESAIRGAESIVSRFTKILDRAENPEETQAQSMWSAEDLQYGRDRARATRPRLKATIPVNTAALEKLRAVIQQHPVEQFPDLLSTQDWDAIATELDQIPTADFRWITTRHAETPYMGEAYRVQRFKLVRPDTVRELRASLTKINSAVLAIVNKHKGSVRGRETRLSLHAALSPEAKAAISDRRRFILDHAARTLEPAKAHVETARETWKRLTNLIGMLFTGVDNESSVSDELWGAALELVSGTVVSDFDLEVLLPAVTPREEILIESRTMLEPESNRGSELRSLEAYRHFAATRLYADDPDQLPHEVQAHFEPIWASAALESHDGMGGLPRWDGTDPRYFMPALFMAPDDSKRFLKENPHWTPPRAPFDRDNALLLQLFSDPLVGWMWGDVSNLVLLVPRDDLAKANFDNVIAITSG